MNFIDSKKDEDVYMSLWKSLDLLRGTLEPSQSLNLILFMLLWAKHLPKSKSGAIGYFDLIESLSSKSEIDNIHNFLVEQIKIRSDLLFGFGLSEADYYKINSLRMVLMPAAQIVLKGEEKKISKLISYLESNAREIFGKLGSFRINEGILSFSKMVFDELSKKDSEINCLYPFGTTSAYYFARERNVYINEKNGSNEAFIKGEISLYGEPSKIINSFKERDLSFVAPVWGEKRTQVLDYSSFDLISENSPYPDIPDIDEDLSVISDPHCKRIYIAHKATKNITIAISNIANLFSSSNGIKIFRRKIIENNWLDAIIQLPQGAFSGTQAIGIIFILKKDRNLKDKINFIDFSNFQREGKTRRGVLNIPEKEIKNLLKTYLNKKNSETSNLVSTEQIKKNDYDLNFNKYLFSEEEKRSFKILKQREVVTLDSLVSFVRPILLFNKDIKKGTELNEVMLSDINYIGEIISPQRKTKVSEQILAKSKFPFIKKGDLVISIRGTLGKIGIIPNELPNTIPGPSLCVLRPHESALVKAEYIFQYLRSELGQKMIFSASQGGINPFISIKDLKNLSIPLPTLKEQNASIKTSKKSKELVESIERMQQELDKCIRDGWLPIDEKKSGRGK